MTERLRELAGVFSQTFGEDAIRSDTRGLLSGLYFDMARLAEAMADEIERIDGRLATISKRVNIANERIDVVNGRINIST